MSKIFVAADVESELHLTTKGYQYELTVDSTLIITVDTPVELSRADLQFICDTCDLFTPNRPYFVEVFVEDRVLYTRFGSFNLD